MRDELLLSSTFLGQPSRCKLPVRDQQQIGLRGKAQSTSIGPARNDLKRQCRPPAHTSSAKSSSPRRKRP